MFGGNGIVADYNVARFFADAEALYSYEGTYQMQNLIVGKAITGFSAFVCRSAPTPAAPLQRTMTMASGATSFRRTREPISLESPPPRRAWRRCCTRKRSRSPM